MIEKIVNKLIFMLLKKGLNTALRNIDDPELRKDLKDIDNGINHMKDVLKKKGR